MSVTPGDAPTRPAYVRDAAGLYYKVGGGGGAPEVYAQATDPGASTTDIIWVDIDDTSFDVAAATASVAGRNRIINGDFSINQRATLSTTTGSTYLMDRWMMAINGGTNSISWETAVLGELPTSAGNYARVVSSGGSSTTNFVALNQTIESVRTLSGKTITVSFWARAASGTPKLGVGVQQYFGTGGGSSTAYSPGGLITLSTTWARYSVTFSVLSIAGQAIGTSNTDGLLLRLYVSAGSTYDARMGGALGHQNNTFDFWGVQVEEGSVATPFEQKPYADELRDCQRYYYRTPVGSVNRRYGIGLGNTSSLWVLFNLPVTMRTSPTFGASAPAYFSAWDGTANLVATGVAADAMSPDICSFTIQGTFVANRPYQVTNSNTTLGYIDFYAEL